MDNENCITIYRDISYQNRFVIATKNNFFLNKKIKCVIDENFITISVPTLDYLGKAFTPQKQKNGWWRIVLTSEHLSNGKYIIDEYQSTEDELVIHLKDKIPTNNGKIQ